MFSIKQHKAKLNSCSTDVIFMLHGASNAIEMKCLSRTALISSGVFSAFVLSKERNEVFRGSFLHCTSSMHSQDVKLLLKLNKISMVKYFRYFKAKCL